MKPPEHPASHYAEQLHLLKLPTMRDGSLQFQTVILRRCEAGDWDLIHLDYRHSPQPVLYSLEDLETGKPIATAAPGEKALFETGADLNAAIAPSPGIRHLGFFICRDGEGRKGCLGKPYQDPNAGLAEYEAERRTAKTELLDRIYFFRYVAWVPGTGFVTPGLILKRDDMGYRLDHYLRAVAPGQPATPLDTLRRIEDLPITLGSVPLVPQNRAIQITLPRFDSSKCLW